jgi:hypothetical protein
MVILVINGVEATIPLLNRLSKPRIMGCSRFHHNNLLELVAVFATVSMLMETFYLIKTTTVYPKLTALATMPRINNPVCSNA